MVGTVLKFLKVIITMTLLLIALNTSTIDPAGC